MAPQSQPLQQFLAGGGNVGAGDANLGKAQFQSPCLYFFYQRDPIDTIFDVSRWCVSIGVHFVHSQNHSPVCDKSTLSLSLPDELATIALGRELASLLVPGMVIWLDGDLGAGKTTLARALLRGLGHTGPVKSPTYTLVEVYVVSSIYLYHFDFYRFNEPEEFADAGLGEYFRENAVCLVEWPEKAAGYVPPADLALVFSFPDEAVDSGRRLELFARSEVGQKCLNELSKFQLGAGGS